MLDIQYIRENAEAVAEKSKQKGYDVDVTQLLGFDDERRQLLTQVEDLRRQRNELSAQSKGQKPSEEQLEKGRELKEALADLEHKLGAVEDEFVALLKKVPNMPADDVPVGETEDENQVVKTVGEPTKFDFEPKNHWEIGEARDWIDKERAAKVTGARFAYIKGDLVQLQFAIIQFVLATLTDQQVVEKLIKENNLNLQPKAFTPILPPVMIREDTYDQMDRLEPREDRYHIEGDDDQLWLIGSAEHTLGSMYANEILPEADLPLRYVGYSTSFRQEAGTYGKDNEGILRMHQFDKLEMETFSTAETGSDEHLLMIAIQEYLMQQLQIPYHVLMKCTADIGKPNARGVDIEAWLPGQDKYRETHTADFMTDYQARRLKTRVKKDDGSVALIHTNDATAFALGRAMIAIIENFQTKDGKVVIPEVLRAYMGGRSEI
ncbi:serine--tRNA ligase [Candidatus Saccharibacteria bacterium]|nr:serine--tRNA ligase [Candidatus Saccharibacteria bacterium]